MTFELGFGFGGARASLGGEASATFGGVLGVNAGLGVWVTPSTALTFRLAGSSGSREVLGRYTARQVGLGVQQMVSREMWLGGGGGVAILTSDQDGSRPDGGPFVNLRAGVNFYESPHHAVYLAVEVTHGFLDHVDLSGISMQLGWQRL